MSAYSRLDSSMNAGDTSVISLSGRVLEGLDDPVRKSPTHGGHGNLLSPNLLSRNRFLIEAITNKLSNRGQSNGHIRTPGQENLEKHGFEGTSEVKVFNYETNIETQGDSSKSKPIFTVISGSSKVNQRLYSTIDRKIDR